MRGSLDSLESGNYPVTHLRQYLPEKSRHVRFPRHNKETNETARFSMCFIFTRSLPERGN